MPIFWCSVRSGRVGRVRHVTGPSGPCPSGSVSRGRLSTSRVRVRPCVWLCLGVFEYDFHFVRLCHRDQHRLGQVDGDAAARQVAVGKVAVQVLGGVGRLQRPLVPAHRLIKVHAHAALAVHVAEPQLHHRVRVPLDGRRPHLFRVNARVGCVRGQRERFRLFRRDHRRLLQAKRAVRRAVRPLAIAIAVRGGVAPRTPHHLPPTPQLLLPLPTPRALHHFLEFGLFG